MGRGKYRHTVFRWQHWLREAAQRAFLWGGPGFGWWKMEMEEKTLLGMAVCPAETSAAPVHGAGTGDALHSQSLAASLAPAMSPGKAMGEGKDPKPQLLRSACPQSFPKPRASAAPLGARVQAKSKAALGRMRGKGSLIRSAWGQMAKLIGMWRCTLARGRPAGGA